jgi:aspartate kinase
MKFGGTSLEDSVGFERVAQVLRSRESQGEPPPVAVVSAMSGVTDALVMSLRLTQEGQGSRAEQLLDEHFERHLAVAVSIGASAAADMRVLLRSARQEITDLLASPSANGTTSAAARDAISSYGEILSAQLLTLVLNEYGSPACYVDARRCLKTNGNHGNATPLDRETTRHTRAELMVLLNQKKLPVLGGFIGATKAGVTTTMGRGSSDYTATIVSAALKARETQIWTDVNGVHTADPHLVKSARTISQLSYDEAAELARLGARVLHQRMFEPVRAQQIPIRICNSHAPQEMGTLISAQGESREAHQQIIKGIAHKNHLVRIDIRSTPTLVANGFQRSIEAILDRHQVAIGVVARSEDGLSLACDDGASLGSIIHDLQRCGSVQVTGRRAIISCVGEGLRSSSAGATAMTEILEAFDSTLVWQKTSSLNLISVVAADLVVPLVRRLHREIFEQ